ncbi:MAG: hypothetical protein EBS18_04810 [Actinobacteria bacterium]|jgi:hypothetical protein|nr:hypothetical protein [Actinomycetota bacterium]
MSEEQKPANDAKAKMLEALAKKQKGNTTGKSAGPTSGSKVGSGQTGGAAPKMHRRKSGSA